MRSTPEEREELRAAWEDHDAYPGERERAVRLHDAERAIANDHYEVSAERFRDLCVALRRAGWSYEECIAGAERALDRPAA